TILHAAGGDRRQDRPNSSSESSARASRHSRPENDAIAWSLGLRRSDEQGRPDHGIQEWAVPHGRHQYFQPPTHGKSQSDPEPHNALREYPVEGNAAPTVQSAASFELLEREGNTKRLKKGEEMFQSWTRNLSSPFLFFGLLPGFLP